MAALYGMKYLREAMTPSLIPQYVCLCLDVGLAAYEACTIVWDNMDANIS